MLRLFDSENRDITDQLEYCGNPSCLGEPYCSAFGICKAQEPAVPVPEQATDTDMESGRVYSELELMLLHSGSTHDHPSSTHVHPSSTPPVNLPLSSNTPLSTHSGPFHPATPPLTTTKNKRVFASIKTDSEVESARAADIPQKTQQDTKYCIGIWEEWTLHRAGENGDIIGSIGEMNKEEMSHWLSRFILEVKLTL